MPEVRKLVEGFHDFRDLHFKQNTELFEQLNNGQDPHTLIIACSDSRVDPALLTQAKPGDIFVIRNVANIVPPYEKGGGYHGVSSAIEFAVNHLHIESVVVMGHEKCGGIKALMTGSHDQRPGSFIGSWVQIAAEAKKEVLQEYPHESIDRQVSLCAKKAVLISLENLMSFPFIVERMKSKSIRLYGWFFDLEKGRLLEFDYREKVFKEI